MKVGDYIKLFGFRIRKNKHAKLKLNRIFIIFGVLVLIAFGVNSTITSFSESEISEKIKDKLSVDEEPEITYIGDIPVIHEFIPEGTLARPGIEREIKYIVMHETDNFSKGSNAKAHNEFLISQADTQELSWHYTVDDTEIYHNLPDNEVGYHASDKLVEDGGNLNGIGIEICVNIDSDYEKALENTVSLVANLLYEYDLTIDAVKKHEDFSPIGKICPAKLIETGSWEQFLSDIEMKRLLLVEVNKTILD